MKNLVFLSFFTIHIAFAQKGQYHFELVGFQQGIPTREINQVGIDSNHFLWLASSKGLLRYDGYDFRQVSKRGIIQNFSFDHHDNLFFEQGDNGLTKVNLSTLNISTLDQPNWKDSYANNDHFANPFIDTQNRVWASDFYNAKLYIRPNKWISFNLFEASNKDVNRIHFFEDSEHQLWILGGQKLFLFDEKSQKPIVKTQCLSKHDFVLMREINKHKYLLGTNYGDIYLFDNETNKIEYLINLNQEVRDILLLNAGESMPKVLISCQHQLFEFDIKSQKLSPINCFEELEPEFGNLVEDHKLNCFWLASNIGLIKIQDSQKPISIVEIPKEISQKSGVLVSFVEYKTNHFYVASSNGMLLDWDKTNNQFKIIDNPYHARINKIALAANGNLLLASTEGILELKKNSKILEKLLFLKNSNITSIGFDAHQNLWILPQSQEILVLDYAHLKPLKLWNDVPMKDFWTLNHFKDIEIDNKGKVWIIAWFPTDFGVCFYDEKLKKFQLTSANNDHNHFIGDFFIDGLYHQNLLYAAGSGGFNVFDDRGKIVQKHEFKMDEYYDNHDYSKMVFDNQNHLWVGSRNGLYWFKKLGGSVIKFNEKDGLKTNDTSDGFLLTKQNELLIGQKNAISVIDIAKLKQEKIPNIYLTNLQILAGRTLSSSAEPIVLERNENSIEVTFSTLNYEINPTSIFRYRLKKGDQNWIQNAQRNKLVLVGLSPDQYELEIAVGNNRGSWNAQTLKIRFEVKPFFFETIWFKLLIISILILALYTFYRYRLAQILQLQKIRTEISADLHDDVGATLSSISILSTILKRQTPENSNNQKYLDTILDDTLSLQNKLEEIIWSLHPDRDTVGQFGVRLRMVGSELFEASGIDYTFEIAEEISHLRLSMQLRRNLLLIAKEAVNNLLKYAHCQKATIVLKKQKNNLLLIISDNGKGFDLGGHQGNGMGNMKKRAEKIKGKLTINSVQHKGTEVRLEVPITQMGD